MNTIVIELCTEDRARIDRLTEAMERRACDGCVKDSLAWAESVMRAAGAAVAPNNAPDAVEGAQPPQTTHPIDEELPWAEAAPSPAPVKAPSLAEFQKALTLRCAESEETKAKVRALLHEYAPAASKVPEDKRAEVLERLAKL
jgi:hypothetical protein